jgi:hypothetical protein
MTFALVTALLASGPAFAQTASSAATKAATTSPIADVYVQTQSGVNVYNAGATGQLTLVKGSPFYEPGQMEGINGAYLISVGTDELHAYSIESDGALGPQASVIDTQRFAGYQCGTTAGPALLDHTGKFFAVGLAGTTTQDCSALQTYKIAPNGEFTYLNAMITAQGVHSTAYQLGVSTFSSDDVWAYGVQSQQDATVFLAYRDDTSAGDLEDSGGFSHTDPTPNPSVSSSMYAPWLIQADNASHLAVVMNMPFSTNDNVFQLASYTINDKTGEIVSTNTWANMPTLPYYPYALAMSWAGQYAAVGESAGLQVFHFNGAAPATADGGVLLADIPIDQVSWDKQNHLYALSYEQDRLYVFTVSASGIAQAPGSPYTIEKPYGWTGMIVVPK